MSETSYLKLFKHDEVLEQNTNFFDIRKSMNNNWDKIDEGVKNAVAKFTEPLKYKGQVTNVSDLPSGATSGDIYNVTSLNKNYIWNGTEWVEYSSTLDLTYLENNTKGSQITPENKSLEITNCAGVNGKLSIKSGETEQNSYSGKNYLPIKLNQSSTLNGITVTYDKKTGKIKINGTATANTTFSWLFDDVKLPDTTYVQYENDFSTTNAQIGYMNGSTTIGSLTFGELNRFHNLEAIDGATINQCYLFIASGTTINGTCRPMIHQYNTIQEWEPYVGGQASPNPDYPQDVISVGSNVNLLENTATSQIVNGVRFTVNSDGTVLANGTATALASITLATNPDFEGEAILSGCPDGGSDSKYFLQYSDNVSISYKDFGNGIKVQHLTGTNSVVVIAVRSGVTVNNLLFKPQIKKEVSGYSKYGCGSVDFKVQNKNFANCDGMQTTTTNGMTFTVNKEDGLLKSIKLNGTVADYDAYLVGTSYILKAGTYKIFGNGLNNNIIMQILNSTMTQQFFYAGKNDTEITVEQDTEVVIRYRVVVGTTFNNVELFPKIYLSTETETEYVPHQEQIITVPLPEGVELCKIGDYKDYPHIIGNKWYTHKEYKSEIVNSATTSNVTSVASDTLWGYSYRTTNPNTKLFGTSQSSYINVLSNKFKVVSQAVETQSGICLAPFGHSDWFELRFRVPKTYTQQEAIDFINGTKVYYPCEPVEEEITDTDTLEALYKIEHLLMYEGYTTIECLNDVKPTIQAEYLYNNEINTSFGSIIDALEERIHLLEQSGVSV